MPGRASTCLLSTHHRRMLGRPCPDPWATFCFALAHTLRTGSDVQMAPVGFSPNLESHDWPAVSRLTHGLVSVLFKR
jgi:hypothetical protein